MDDWKEDFKERLEGKTGRRVAEKRIPYIVDLVRKREVIEATSLLLTNFKDGIRFELGNELKQYNRNTLIPFCERFEKAIDGVDDSWDYGKGQRNILMNKLFDSDITTDELFDMYDNARGINADLRTMSAYWDLCGFTFPLSDNDLTSLMLVLYHRRR